MTDDDSFTGRVRRYAQVSSAMGGLAARLAGERYLGISVDRGRHAADLKAALGGIKGPLMKVAQLLATIPDALPKEYVNELVQLQANAPAMGWPFVRRRMEGELGAELAAPVPRSSSGMRRAPPRSARCIGRRRSTAPRSPANCSTPTWPRRSRPICAS